MLRLFKSENFWKIENKNTLTVENNNCNYITLSQLKT